MNINDELEQAFRQGYNSAEKLQKELKAIADHYGFTSQADMLIEESAEFTQAVNKLRRGCPEAFTDVKEEVADVLVVALQLRYILGEKTIDNIIGQKIQRQLRRINDEKID